MVLGGGARKQFVALQFLAGIVADERQSEPSSILVMASRCALGQSG